MRFEPSCYKLLYPFLPVDIYKHLQNFNGKSIRINLMFGEGIVEKYYTIRKEHFASSFQK